MSSNNYRHSVAPAIASNYSRAGVVVNFVTATGGDVEMLRSIECFYKYAFSSFCYDRYLTVHFQFFRIKCVSSSFHVYDELLLT